jgi:uncharacterized membrane protein
MAERVTVLAVGAVLLVVGIIVDAATASKNAACAAGGSPTLLGIPGRPTPTGCGGANAAAAAGLALIVIGVICLIVGLVVVLAAAKRSRDEETRPR